MRKILEVLRLHFEAGLSGRAIALAVSLALSTVGTRLLSLVPHRPAHREFA